MFGHSSTKIAPYTVVEKEDNLELRYYERLLLVSTPTPEGLEDQKAPFYKLFDYLSGKNQDTREIPMTTPVFMNQAGQKTETMAFVLPTSFTIEEVPQPQDPAVKLEHITDYLVATITFSGSLSQDNINQHKALLEKWIM